MYEPGDDAVAEKAFPIDELRAAIQTNRISFPLPVPVFPNQHRADIQWRMVELYFVQGWSPRKLATRYDVTTTRVRQALRNWVRRATTLGYLQTIPVAEESPEAFAAGMVVSSFLPDSVPLYSSVAFLQAQEARQEHV